MSPQLVAVQVQILFCEFLVDSRVLVSFLFALEVVQD